MSQRSIKKGFTLVEILIVVVILGILAAIVIPQFSSASEMARAKSLLSQLQTLRSQLELYQVEHGGDYPALASFWAQMTGTTDVDGVTTGSDFGPYLQKESVNPMTGGSTVASTNAGDWLYTASTGEIKGVIDADDWGRVEELGLGSETEANNNDFAKGPSS